MCLACKLDLPRASEHLSDFNAIHQRLGHATAVDRAAAWFYYRKQSPYSRLLIDAKYSQLPMLARKIGAMCAQELMPTGFFEGIDGLVPMPMYWLKRAMRGYNQAVEICRGISRVTGIPVADVLKAVRGHGVQSRQSRDQRYQGIAGTLALRRGAVVQGRSLLFVDDILTTGASAAEALRALATGAPAAIHLLCMGLTAYGT